MRVVVVAPHPDDEAIGCGGAIARHADAGDAVSVTFVTSGELALRHLPREQAWEIREAEAVRAADVLGVERMTFLRRPDWYVGDDLDELTRLLEDVFERESPDRVYVPHENEWHPDHRAANTSARRAAASRGIASGDLHAYEVWTPLAEYGVIADISAVMSRKLAAIAAYESQREPFDYAHAASGLNSYRGALASQTAYAEVFGRCAEIA